MTITDRSGLSLIGTEWTAGLVCAGHLVNFLVRGGQFTGCCFEPG
jgi:hypothetical protein